MSEIGTQNRSRIEIRVRFKGKLYEMNMEAEPEDVRGFAVAIGHIISGLHTWATINLEQTGG